MDIVKDIRGICTLLGFIVVGLGGTYWYMKDKQIISSGPGATLDLYFKCFAFFGVIGGIAGGIIGELLGQGISLIIQYWYILLAIVAVGILWVKKGRNIEDTRKKMLFLGVILLMVAVLCGGYTYIQNKEVTNTNQIMAQNTNKKVEKKTAEYDNNYNNSSYNNSEYNNKMPPNQSATSASKTNKETPNWHWIKDNNTGVYIWNPEPIEGESIVWNGGYVQDGEYRYANGAGIVTWYKDGKVIQVDDGAFIRGRHHGHFTHKFPSGRVEYSNWDNGREI